MKTLESGLDHHSLATIDIERLIIGDEPSLPGELFPEVLR